MTPSDWSAGVEGALAIVTAPCASTQTRSVNVPPTSMPIRSTAQRPSAETKPSVLSPARSSAVRCFGSPQPPPPPECACSTSPGLSTMPVSLVLSARSGRPADCSQ